MKRKFTVRYSYYFSGSEELEAESEAVETCRQLIANEQIGDVTTMVPELKVWVD